MSWDMIDDDAAVLEAVQAKWLSELFESEYCAECGGDAIDHIAGSDVLGNMHAYCKPIEVGERVEFVSARDAKLVGTVIETTGKALDRRLQIIADGDSYTSHWVIAEGVMRSQPA